MGCRSFAKEMLSLKKQCRRITDQSGRHEAQNSEQIWTVLVTVQNILVIAWKHCHGWNIFTPDWLICRCLSKHGCLCVRIHVDSEARLRLQPVDTHGRAGKSLVSRAGAAAAASCSGAAGGALQPAPCVTYRGAAAPPAALPISSACVTEANSWWVSVWNLSD